MSDNTEPPENQRTNEGCSCPKPDLRPEAEPQQPDEDCPTHGRCDMTSTAGERCRKSSGHRNTKAMGDPCVFTDPADHQHERYMAALVGVSVQQLREAPPSIRKSLEKGLGQKAAAAAAVGAADLKAEKEKYLRFRRNLLTRSAEVEIENARLSEALREAFNAVDTALAAETNDEHALELYEVLLKLGAARPHTCARSQGLHEQSCPSYVPGHESASPVNGLRTYRTERGLPGSESAPAPGSGGPGPLTQIPLPRMMWGTDPHGRHSGAGMDWYVNDPAGQSAMLDKAVEIFEAHEAHAKKAKERSGVDMERPLWPLTLVTDDPECTGPNLEHTAKVTSLEKRYGATVISWQEWHRRQNEAMKLFHAPGPRPVNVVWAVDPAGIHDNTEGIDWRVTDPGGPITMYRAAVEAVEKRKAYVHKQKEEHGIEPEEVKPSWKLTLITDEGNGTGPNLERVLEVAQFGRPYGVEVLTWEDWFRRQQRDA